MNDLNESRELFPTDESDIEILPVFKENRFPEIKAEPILIHDDEPASSKYLLDDDSEPELIDAKNGKRTTPPRTFRSTLKMTDFFAPGDSPKVKIEAESLIKKRSPKFQSKPKKKPAKPFGKDLKFDPKTGVLLSTIDLTPDPGQLSIESHLKWKDNREVQPKFVKKPKIMSGSLTRCKTPPIKKEFTNDSVFNTPSPSIKDFSRARSNSPDSSPRKRLKKLQEEFQKSLLSPNFLARKQNSVTNVLNATKKKIEGKSKGKSLKFFMNNVEKIEEKTKKNEKTPEKQADEEDPCPPTPEHYWEVDMPDYEEQKRRRYIFETDSPIKLKRRKLF